MKDQNFSDFDPASITRFSVTRGLTERDCHVVAELTVLKMTCAGMCVSAVRNLVKNACGKLISCFRRSTGIRGGIVV
jgi:hypothetical protein